MQVYDTDFEEAVEKYVMMGNPTQNVEIDYSDRTIRSLCSATLYSFEEYDGYYSVILEDSRVTEIDGFSSLFEAVEYVLDCECVMIA